MCLGASCSLISIPSALQCCCLKEILPLVPQAQQIPILTKLPAARAELERAHDCRNHLSSCPHSPLRCSLYNFRSFGSPSERCVLLPFKPRLTSASAGSPQVRWMLFVGKTSLFLLCSLGSAGKHNICALHRCSLYGYERAGIFSAIKIISRAMKWVWLPSSTSEQ